MNASLDGELADREPVEIQAHLAECARCRAEWEEIRALSPVLSEYERSTHVDAPAEMWAAIERRLARSPKGGASFLQSFRRPLALAASLALVIGVGFLLTIALDGTTTQAQAALVDYSILMEGVAADVHASINRFLGHYKAEPVDRDTAHQHAPGLSFDVPETLPGGYRLIGVYRLQFGTSAGVAATYDHKGDPVFLIFHPMTDNTSGPSGTSCKVGELHGSQIEVGRWRLLHIMDATTCHCVLTTMDPGPELEDLVRAVALDLPNPDSHEHQQHQLAH